MNNDQILLRIKKLKASMTYVAYCTGVSKSCLSRHFNKNDDYVMPEAIRNKMLEVISQLEELENKY